MEARSGGLWEALRPPPWFGLDDVFIFLGVLGLIYWAYRLGPRRPPPRGPFWPR